jgi:hypothetical protein
MRRLNPMDGDQPGSRMPMYKHGLRGLNRFEASHRVGCSDTWHFQKTATATPVGLLREAI